MADDGRIMFSRPVIKGFAVALLCAASIAGWFAATAPTPEVPAPSEPAPPLPKEAAPPVRDVTPPRALPGPAAIGELTRLPARQPPPPPSPPLKPTIFHRPVVISAGVIEAEDETIRLAGIEPLAADATCRDDEGTDWRCGKAAATAFRMLVGRRSFSCGLALLPAATFGESASRYCRIGRTDPGLWLVAQGWASPAEGAPDEYREAAKEARDGRRGRYGAGPSTD